MKIKTLLLTILIILVQQHISAQDHQKYPQDYFRPPIDGRIYLSGTFGELRSNHFHAGIDIKTGGVEGKNIYAAANGWVSRVKISPWGYGHAVYIEHPNGFTTVYGHLKELKEAIAEYVEKQQYKRQKFAVDLYLEAHEFPVKKGEIIALSGNTGGSGGPHLHFEIRNTSTQEPINPLLFGIEVKDYITPQINAIRIYPTASNTLIDESSKAKSFKLKGWGKNYQLLEKDTITIEGDFYLGINTYDKQNDSNNKNGVYQIEVWVDSSIYFMQNVEKINFSTSRYINTLIDFDYYKKYQSRFQRTYISPNNELEIYKTTQQNGIFSFKDNSFHQIKYIVKDVMGNKSILSFTIHSKVQINLEEPHQNDSLFLSDQENNFENDEIAVFFPKNSLYDTLLFSASSSENSKSFNNTIYSIGRIGVGLQKSISVELKDIDIPSELKNKVYIGEYYKKEISPYSAEWKQNNISFKTRDFGQYLILVDSIPPKIHLLTKLKPHTEMHHLKFKVSDDESGIKNYDAWLNGAWTLMKWDPKKSSMICDVSKAQIGNNLLKIIISDEVGNISRKEIEWEIYTKSTTTSDTLNK